MESVERIEHKGFSISIFVDETPFNPIKDFDVLGKLVCFHNRYDLGNDKDFESPKEFAEYMERNLKSIIVMPLFLYDHSGISISTRSFIRRAHHASWDSGQVGWIFADRESILKTYQKKRLTKNLIRLASHQLECEVKEYDDYLTGSVYGYEVYDENGNEVDSCWGFFGSNHSTSGLMDCAKENIESEISERNEAQLKLDLRTV